MLFPEAVPMELNFARFLCGKTGKLDGKNFQYSDRGSCPLAVAPLASVVTVRKVRPGFVRNRHTIFSNACPGLKLKGLPKAGNRREAGCQIGSCHPVRIYHVDELSIPVIQVDNQFSNAAFIGVAGAIFVLVIPYRPWIELGS